MRERAGGEEFKIHHSSSATLLSAKECNVNRKTRRVAVYVWCVALAAGVAWAKVRSDWDPKAEFSSYSTYAWMERDHSIESLLPEHLKIRLRRVTEDVLAEKGLEPAPAPPQTDLLLTYYFSATDELQINHIPWGTVSPWGYGYWGGFNYGYTEVRSYKEGTLVLDIVDARTHQLVWTGVVEREITNVNPPGKRIQKTVRKLLKSFPPE